MPTWSPQLQPYGCKVAVDTSDAPLAALAAGFSRAAPDLIKPNSEELAGLAGVDPEYLETALAQGNPDPVVNAAHQLIERGARTVLATLGAAGAVLVNETGSWLATPPPIKPRSTVGAGDSSLAGYVRADVGGAASAATAADGGRLRQRRRRIARLGTAVARTDRPRRRIGHLDFALPAPPATPTRP